MVLVVLALDAVDINHAEDFGCENILLDEHTRMQSVAHRLDHPHTGEAWPSIATGLHPTEHGITGHGEWDSQALTILSRVAHKLNVSGDIRGMIGDAIKQSTGQDWSLQVVDESTFLDGEYRAVHNWPGVYRNEALHCIWRLFEEVKQDRMSEETLIRETYTEAASKFGWVHEAITHDIEIAASHIHVIDVLGHIYSDDRKAYKQVYEDVDERVGAVRAALCEDDELLILSDHGMQTTWLDDDHPGTHSWRAIASTTVGSPPKRALDVKQWVNDHTQEIKPEQTQADIPEDQLRKLGYIE